MIKGYRDLSQKEIDLMNEIKEIGPKLEALLKKIDRHVELQSLEAKVVTHTAEIARIEAATPARWVALARDSAQTALMYATRAVAQPSSF